MGYSIKQVSKMTSLSEYTLRYYEKEGLIPFISRNKAGNRVFSDCDIEMLGVVCCLKKTGMPIKDIRQYIEWCLEGDKTLEIRRQMFKNHRNCILIQIDELKANLTKIDQKIQCL